jgi:hypothetical protein
MSCHPWLLMSFTHDEWIVSFRHRDFASSRTRLFRAFLDIFDLFRAVMPIRHGRLIATVPTIGMQFANDCNWISYDASKLVRDKAASRWETQELAEAETTLRNLAELGRQKRREQLVSAHCPSATGKKG